MIRCCLLALPLLVPVAAWAQTAPFVPDLTKPDATSLVTPYTPNGGVASPVRVEKEGNALKMTSLAGGSFGVELKVPPFNVDELTRLSFDYTATPDAKVNIFFRVNNQRYFAALFTGPKKVRAGTAVIYDAHVSKLSGHIEIPLRAAIRSQMPTDGTVRVDQILVGNWENEGYMMAGIGGNGPGASWTLSNFKLEKPDVKPTFGAARFEGDELVVPAQNLDNVSFKSFPLKTSLGEMAVAYDPLREAFVYDASVAYRKPASTAPEPLRDGQNVDYTLRDDKNTVLSEGKAAFHFQGLTPPAPPRLELTNPDDKYPRIDFEDDSVPFGMDRNPTNTIFGRDSQNPYNGQWSAVLTNARTAYPFDLPLGESTVDVATHPVLTFAYRCDDRLRLDVNLTWNNQPYSVHFTDSDNPNPRLGDFKVIRDGQWHLAQINLLDAMKKAQPNATEFKITNMTWNDTGWPGNVKGLKWWLDDLKWAPKTEGKLEGTAMLDDATGTTGVSYILDQTPTTQADQKAEGGPKLSIDLTGKTGLWWLHVRGENGANKWSETAHYPIWCG